MFLKVKNENIITPSGRPVMLKGVNLGSWLMMEGYILGGRMIPEQTFKKNFAKVYGKQGLRKFSSRFRDNYIQEQDFRTIKGLGFNCVRIPFNYRLVRDKQGLGYLEKAVAFCKKYKLWAILDLHAAPGSQNPDWHADSLGEALLWKNKTNQEKFIQTWQILARRFKNEATIAGYDILNEAVCASEKLVLSLYKRTVKAIRAIDTNHIIFLEGNRWDQDIEFLGKPWDDNMVYSVHFYHPIDFIFGFIRNLQYPGKMPDGYWSKARLKKILNRYYRLKKAWRVPILVGEFGQNTRCSYCHKEFRWLEDTLDLFQQFGFHWTYWTFKAVALGIQPDGIYQYQPNPSWINRNGPVFSWETWYSLWGNNKQAISESWKTGNFTPNKHLISILKAHL